MPFCEATACFMAVLRDRQQGHAARWHWVCCASKKWRQSSPTRAVSSNRNMLVPFTFPATHFRLLSPARDATQSRLFQLLFSRAGSSSKSPCNCQELCNSVIRVSKPAGNKGPWGSEGRVFLTFLLGKLQHKAPS